CACCASSTWIGPKKPAQRPSPASVTAATHRRGTASPGSANAYTCCASGGGVSGEVTGRSPAAHRSLTGRSPAVSPRGSPGGVRGDQGAGPADHSLTGARLGSVVAVHEPEALGVPLRPLEVVQQRPGVVAGHVDT